MREAENPRATDTRQEVQKLADLVKAKPDELRAKVRESINGKISAMDDPEEKARASAALQAIAGSGQATDALEIAVKVAMEALMGALSTESQQLSRGVSSGKRPRREDDPANSETPALVDGQVR
eukprot:6401692-Alexandrium_andersonii.AAC.1